MGHEHGSFKEMICFGNDYVQSLLNVYYGSRWFHIEHFIMSNRSSFKSLRYLTGCQLPRTCGVAFSKTFSNQKNFDDSKMKSRILGNTPLKTNMSIKNSHCSIGNTSSNGGFSIVMLVFGEVNSKFLGWLVTHWIHVCLPYIYLIFTNMGIYISQYR